VFHLDISLSKDDAAKNIQDVVSTRPMFNDDTSLLNLDARANVLITGGRDWSVRNEVWRLPL